MPGDDLELASALGKAPVSGMLAVTERGRERLSTETVALFNHLRHDIIGTPITTLIRALDELIAYPRARSRNATPPIAIGGVVPQLKSVGVAELLVVKQQITRYEPGEIAHIENVLQGERKLRTHRKLDRTEEETEWYSENVVTQERELETTERFELNKETNTTAQKDQQKGFGLSVSGRYGPTIEFSSELTVQNNASQTETTRSAVNYAKDIVERSKDSIVSTVREQRGRREIREVEEVNEHELSNDSGAHTAGIYQFMDKIYTSRVFNYGLREMFDFLVPEPASYLIHLNNAPRTDLELPVPPVDLSAFAADASDIDESNYLELGARYNVAGLTPPPPSWIIRRQRVTHGEGAATEEDQPRSFSQAEVEIPQGYTAIYARVSVLLTSDEWPTMVIRVGGAEELVLKRADMATVGVSQGNFDAYTHSRFILLPDESSDHVGAEKLVMHVFANESANYDVSLKVWFWRNSAPLGWQLKTYEAIAEAYRNQLLQYQQTVEEIKARREQESVGAADFGSPPARNLRIISAELKKHCLAVLRETHDNALSTLHTGGASADAPPEFDISEALDNGAKIRFLENAFEWDQLQYAFYPYFWARADRWPERFHLRNVDPVLEEFLRAGSARVVVPVTPGFEATIAYFLETKDVWSGQGEPTVEDPLYKPIVEEIKERSGANQGEIPVDAAWETRIPTVAVKLRREDTLPEWVLQPGSDWNWALKT